SPPTLPDRGPWSSRSPRRRREPRSPGRAWWTRRVPCWNRPSRSTSNWAPLAALAAAGRSNPQIGDRLFISRRTVQTHLAHVFAKLDLTSRAQLAALVTQH